MSLTHPSKGGMVPDIGTPAVVLESHHGTAECRAVQNHVPRQTLRFPLRIDIKNSQTLYHRILGAVVIPQQLISTADCKQYPP